MKPDIKTLALERKFGEIERRSTKTGPSSALSWIRCPKNGDVRSGALNLLSRVGFRLPQRHPVPSPGAHRAPDDPDMFIKIDAANAVGNLGFSFKDSAAQAPEVEAHARS